VLLRVFDEAVRQQGRYVPTGPLGADESTQRRGGTVLPHLPLAQPKAPAEGHASAHTAAEAWGFCASEHCALTAMATLVPAVPLALWEAALLAGTLDRSTALEIGLFWGSGPEAAAACAESNTRERRKRGHRFVALTAHEIFTRCGTAAS